MKPFYTSCLKHGNNLLYRGYENGRRVQRRIPFTPTLFVPLEPGKTSDYTSIFGDPVHPMRFESMKEAREFHSQYDSMSNVDVFGTTDFAAQYIQEQWPNQIDFDTSDIRITTIDIEVNCDEGFPTPDKADWPVDAITVKSTVDSKYYVFGLGEYDPSKTELDIDPSDIVYDPCDDEIELLSKFLTWWNSERYVCDVVTGWYIRGFDIPYLFNRISKLMGESKAKLLSPWKMVDEKTVAFKGQEMLTFELKGISQLDFQDVFKKFGYKYGPQESYKLDHIAHVVLGRKKLNYDDYTNMMSIGKGIDHVKPNHAVEAPPKFMKYANALDRLRQEKSRRSE